jgi:uncharacterized membrane protein
MSVSTSSKWSQAPSLQPAFELNGEPFSAADLSASQHWKLARNCSLAPRQLLVVFVALSMLSLTVALFFWLMGARWVMPFACLELMALGVAFVVYARHAGDAEWIVIQGDQLLARRCHAGRWTHWQAGLVWLHVGWTPNGLVELKAAGRSLQVGALASSGQRQKLVQELRGALMAQTAAAV